MSEPNATIRDLRWSEVDAVSRLAVEAFRNDPVMPYLYPDEATRLERFGKLHARFVRYGLRYGLVDAVETPEGLGGKAVWLPPGKGMFSLWRLLRCGIFLSPWTMGRTPYGRFRDMFAASDRLHARSLTGLHWYLFILVVDPRCQGQGLGSRLLEHGFARADADRLPCYLEAVTEKNVAFYRRRGFEVTAEERIGNGAMDIWAMVRPPLPPNPCPLTPDH